MALPVAILTLSLAAATLAPATSEEFGDAVLPVLERYCLACHGGEKTRGGLELTRFTSEAEALAAPDVWSLVRERLFFDEMPPEGRPRPDAAERDELLAWIDARFGPPAELAPPAAPVLRRLNHREYANTVRDLVGVDFEADERFPADEIGHGFDTVGSALSLPELLVERYVEAAEQIAERAIVLDEPGGPPRARYDVELLDGEGYAGEREWVLASHGETGATYRFPRAGVYALRVAAHAQQAGPERARMGLELDRRELATFELAGPRGAVEAHELRLRVAAGPHRVGARFLNDYYQPDEPDPFERDRNLFVLWVEVEGPLDPGEPTDFQRELFARFGPELGVERLRATLAHLAGRAWRRPAQEAELERLLELARGEEDHARAVRLGLQAILSSPRFLFRAESAGELGPFELAARLSYFLWSSTPDAELTALAASGELLQGEVLAAQVERLLDSPRSFALAEGFAAQWLQIERLSTTAVDRQRFPAFDAELRAAMRRESLLYFDALVREGRSAWELLEGEFTFANEALARVYGLEGVGGPELRRVSLAGLPRRGVLTQPSVLTVTSDPTRTSPVKRGKWILETLLGAPPPPPPPGAGALDESAEAVAAASLRERLEQHRADPACAACHDTLDPLGFGLEHFDAIGAWRERDGAFAIDAAGELPDGRAFTGPVELAAVLRADDGFLRCLVQKLATYAIGRGLARADRPAVDAILARLDPERPALRAILRELALSALFRQRGGATSR